jgi:hypothetical protein
MTPVELCDVSFEAEVVHLNKGEFFIIIIIRNVSAVFKS